MPADKYHLVVPLDASGIEDFTPGEKIKVLILRRDGVVEEKLVKFDAEAKGEVTFGFAADPGPLRVALGPAEATSEELLATETIAVDVPARVWAERPKFVLDPIKIAPYYWYWWRRWCRNFSIRGRVVCANGNPVPGATVCAYDVDAWWFWRSVQEVGCATTDNTGAFEIKFRWCCVFLPWWWWRRRIWTVDPWLVRRLKPVLERAPNLRLGRITNQPSLDVFTPLLGSASRRPTRPITAEDAEMLEKLRPRLLERLPAAPELESLKLWPWWPWWPWRDCAPDIIFKVTQDTDTMGTVIVDEDVGDTRWNISDPLTVTLVANEKAWCDTSCPNPPCDDGECMVIIDVCGDPIDTIGGNTDAPPTPAGYLRPSVAPPPPVGPNYDLDRPFAGTVLVNKNSGDMINVDCYTVEYQPAGDLAWHEVNEGHVLPIDRKWLQWLFVPIPPPPHIVWNSAWVYFPWTRVDGHLVVESREHWEVASGLGGWNLNRTWIYHRDLAVPLNSAGFPDGTYNFRVRAWQKDAGGHLVGAGTILPVCQTPIANSFVLTFDNRVVLDPDPAHPHPCGSGTVHLCTYEPDTDFIAVRVDGQEVKPCGVTAWKKDAKLEIDFQAEDVDGHLAYYELLATYGENLAVNLLAQSSSQVTIGMADFLGWASGDTHGTYGRALDQGATAPVWHGGKYTLTMLAGEAFPEPCCYQFELRAYKRTVLGCDHDFHVANLSEYTFGVGLCP